MSFVVFGVTKSWIESIQAETENHYDSKADPKATAEDVSNREAERLRLSIEGTPEEELPPEIAIGDFLTNGRQAFRFETSIGNGKGSTVLPLPATDLPNMLAALTEPVSDLDKLPPSECIRRTIARDAETGEVTFKVSLAKHSRTVIVPSGEWDNFLAYVTKLSENRDEAVKHYRNATAKEEAAEAEKARKAAERKAAGK